MSSFIPGRQLAAEFFKEVVQPILGKRFDRPYAAALLGPGSEVLGFDDETSMDHGWGPRLQILTGGQVPVSDVEASRLRGHLPNEFKGLNLSLCEPYYKALEFFTVDAFLRKILGPAIPSPSEPLNWLLVTQQELRSLTQPNIFHDGIGLADRLNQLSWFPRDIWRYLVASVLSRVDEEEHLVGRAAHGGSELGARLIAGRLVRDLMRVCFLVEGDYAPYPKWLGRGFDQLAISAELRPVLQSVLSAQTWQERDRHLATAYQIVGDAYNALGATPRNRLSVKPFFGRPFSVLSLDSGVKEALLDQIEHPDLQHLKTRRPIGGIEMVSDNTDLLEDHSLRLSLTGLYAAPIQ